MLLLTKKYALYVFNTSAKCIYSFYFSMKCNIFPKELTNISEAF